MGGDSLGDDSLGDDSLGPMVSDDDDTDGSDDMKATTETPEMKYKTVIISAKNE